MVESEERKSEVPDWALGAFRRLLDQTRRLGDLVSLSKSGISMIRDTPRAVEALAHFHGISESAETRKELEEAKQLAELAGREVSEGFPLLHSQAVLTLWALLEAGVRELLADLITNDPSKLENPEFDRLRIRLGEYQRLEPADRVMYVVETLERDLGAPLQSGVTRFERLLASVNLSGEIPELLRKEMFECSQVRNVIAHRAGVVDNRFADSCPWLQLKPGEKLHVSAAQLGMYLRAVHSYIILLICRVSEAFGDDMTEYKDALWSDYGNASSPHAMNEVLG